MINIKRYSGILTLAAITLFSSCSEWDDHFETDNNVSHATSNLYEALCQNSETSRFAELAASVGYDKVLSSSQTYTVFAPSNEALANLETSNEEEIKKIVTNHIARYTNPTSTSTKEGVRMLNGKIYQFDNNTSFEGCHIDLANLRSTNGLLHQIDKQIPYANNIYEHIQSNPKYSKLYQFIHQFDENKFDEENSVEVDIDEEGRPVYDTIMVSYNRLLENKLYGLGHIANEDSTYSMILPDNQAWDAAYNRISPYFKVYDTNTDKADSIQQVRTQLAILSDLIYRGKHATPESEDSLVSTSGSIIHQPSTLFSSATREQASNGNVFSVSQLNYDNTETWNKPISVEGEEQNGRSYNNTLVSAYTRNVKAESSVKNVSGDSYIEVQPISVATNPSVTFEIPNVLAGKYNVYAVLLPATMEGEEVELDSTKIQFSITYVNANGRNTTKSNRSKGLITKSREMTKMLAFENLEFPVSDYTDNLWRMDENNREEDLKVKTTMTVMTNVTAKEYSSKTYTRTFRLDRIILEPIKN